MEDKHFVVKDSTKLICASVKYAPTYSIGWQGNYSYDNQKDRITPTNNDLYELINLREKIIKKLADYKKHAGSYTAKAIIQKKSTVAENNKTALKNATIEIDEEIEKFETLATKYWGDDKSRYAKSADQRYAHDDNQTNFVSAQKKLKDNTNSSRTALAGLEIREGKGYTTAWDPRQSSHKHDGEYHQSTGYNYWYSLFRDHSYSGVGLVYALPLLIGGAIVHGIDALITHVYALAIDTPAENEFKEEINKIEDIIKSDEATVVEQTLFEITREFQTDEYKNFSEQCKSLHQVGFFAPKSETLKQACGQASVAANEAQNAGQSNTLYPKNY